MYSVDILLYMRKTKRAYLTIDQKRSILLKNGDMPTAIFTADKREFIVKPRHTIFGSTKRKRRFL